MLCPEQRERERSTQAPLRTRWGPFGRTPCASFIRAANPRRYYVEWMFIWLFAFLLYLVEKPPPPPPPPAAPLKASLRSPKGKHDTVPIHRWYNDAPAIPISFFIFPSINRFVLYIKKKKNSMSVSLLAGNYWKILNYLHWNNYIKLNFILILNINLLALEIIGKSCFAASSRFALSWKTSNLVQLNWNARYQSRKTFVRNLKRWSLKMSISLWNCGAHVYEISSV